MSERYYITGVQLGIILGLGRVGDGHEIEKLVNNIIDKQFLGHYPLSEKSMKEECSKSTLCEEDKIDSIIKRNIERLLGKIGNFKDNPDLQDKITKGKIATLKRLRNDIKTKFNSPQNELRNSNDISESRGVSGIGKGLLRDSVQSSETPHEVNRASEDAEDTNNVSSVLSGRQGIGNIPNDVQDRFHAPDLDKKILNAIEPILFPITNEDWYIKSGRDSLLFRIRRLIEEGSGGGE